jgi:hypothetical protein
LECLHPLKKSNENSLIHKKGMFCDVHLDFHKADAWSKIFVGTAIEVHLLKGPGLLEPIEVRSHGMVSNRDRLCVKHNHVMVELNPQTPSDLCGLLFKGLCKGLCGLLFRRSWWEASDARPVQAPEHEIARNAPKSRALRIDLRSAEAT